MNETENKFGTPISIPASMPSPPEFLVNQARRSAPKNQDAASDETGDFEMGPTSFQGRSYAPPESRIPKNVDYVVYQSALDDRRYAETTYAEIYSKYLELVDFNEKILRSLRTFERFKGRVRRVYQRAIEGEENVVNHYQSTRQNLKVTEKALVDLQLENESLRVTIKAHEESFQKLIARVAEGESTIENGNRHFEILAQEYENRGVLLDEADRKIGEYVAQMGQMTQSLQELQEKYGTSRDESLMLQSRNRELQLREAAVATLNSEMADSLTQSQKQIHHLESKLRAEREQYETRIAVLEDDLGRFQHDRRASELVTLARGTPNEKTKLEKIREPIVMTNVAVVQPIQTIQARAQTQAQNQSSGPAPEPKAADRKQWGDFHDKWGQIVSELNPHSVIIKKQIQAIKPEAKPAPAASLASVKPENFIAEPELTESAQPLDFVEPTTPGSEAFADQWAEISDLEIL